MAGRAGPLGLPRGLLATARAVVVRPWAWRPALRQLRALTPRRWWTRRPYLPVPDRDWLAFRMTTAYGDPAAPLVATDVLTWLAWSETVDPAVRSEG